MFDTIGFLKSAVSKGASDIHIKIGKPPSLRMGNNIVRIACPPITEEQFEAILTAVVYKDQIEKIRHAHNFDFMFEIQDIARFRVNYCRELGKPKLTLRVIPYEIPKLEDMMLPSSLKSFTRNNNGIILLTGPTGCGKSTSIACMVDSINKDSRKHIVTIEDPIEFIYSDKESLVTQRQLGIDVDSFPEGIKYALRQDPDVIVVGEIRDSETIEAALSAAETGHLVFSTIHTNSAIQTINRIINMFDEHVQDFTRERLASCLKGTIAQRLVERKDNKGRVPAFEILSVTATVQDYIRKNQLDKIYPLIQQGGFDNMVTLNTSLHNLIKSGTISEQEGIKTSDNKTELMQMIKGYYQGTKGIKAVTGDISLD